MGGGGVRKFAMGPEEATPAQTAVMEAALLLGNFAGLKDGTDNQGLSEVRNGNHFEVLAVDDETADG